MKYNSPEEKYSQHTLVLFYRLTKIALVGTGLAVLTLITAIITRPTASDVVPRIIMYSFLAGGALCVVLIFPTLILFFGSARKDRLRRNAGLPVNSAADV